MKLIAATLLIFVVLCGSASAERPWAPGAKAPGKTSSSFAMPPLVLRIGPSFASYSNDDFKERSLWGLQLEAAIRPVSIPIGPNTQFMFDMPLVFSLLRGKESVWYNEKPIGVIGRGIPTARLGITLSNGIEISPFAGFGAGTNLNLYRTIAEDWPLVWVYRVGVDAMISKNIGAGITFSRNSVGDINSSHWVDDQYGGHRVYESEALVLKELSLSLIIKL